MKTILAALLLVPALSWAASAKVQLERAPINLHDKVSLQRGAQIFVNHCLSCHSATVMRYSRLTDFGLTEQQIKDNLLLTADKVGEPMHAGMETSVAKAAFGVVPPDLSLVGRSRGPDWLYTYMRSFYRDPQSKSGWNNTVFPNVAMPHVLWELQGERRPIFDKVESHGHETEVFKGWEQLSPGTMTPMQYDQAMGDLVSYLQWMAEPAQNTRIRVGVWVLLFLVIAVVFVWRLNASYWKDVK